MLQNIVFELFKVSLVSYLLFYTIEELWPTFISDYVDLNILLYTTIVAGVVHALIAKSEPGKSTHTDVSMRHYLLIASLSVIVALVLYFKMKQLGTLAFAIAFLSGVVTFFLSLLLLHEEKIDESVTKQ